MRAHHPKDNELAPIPANGTIPRENARLLNTAKALTL